MLEIYDPSIVEIDPYLEDDKGHTLLGRDQIMRIMTELYRNPWYYLREISRIPDPGGTAVPYKANRGNLAQAWCMIHGIDSWLCLPRQQGKTQSILALFVWIYSFGTSNAQTIFVNKDGENAKNNLRRMVEQIELLPEYLRFESFTDEDGKVIKATKNATTIRHPVNNNSIVVKPKATSYDKALSIARGLTAPLQQYDEPEFTDHIKTIVENSVPTYETAARRAAANGAMYGRAFTCTPGDLDTRAGQQSQSLLDHCAEWKERMYDWNKEDIEEYFKTAKKDCNHILYIEYSYKQLGLTEEWFEAMSAKINNPTTVRREILLQRLHGSSLSPYAQEDIDYILSVERQPIDELWIMDYYCFNIYTPLDRKIPYIIGIDCSTGTVKDNNAITILDPYTVEPVAEFECAYIGETKFEQLIIELVEHHLPRSCVVIERNSVGDGIIDHLLNSSISSRLYFDKAKDLVEDRSNDNQTYESLLKHQAKMKSFYGVYTSGASREDMFAILSRHVNEYKKKFITHNISRDLASLVRKPSGKIEAGGDEPHDDSIMSYLMCLYIYYHGNNLPLFGIIKGAKDSDLTNDGTKRPEEIDPTLVDPRIIAEVKHQEDLKHEMNFEDIMKQAMKEAQKETYKLHQHKQIENTVFDSTPDVVLDDYEFQQGTVDLTLFDELNNF